MPRTTVYSDSARFLAAELFPRRIAALSLRAANG